MTDRFGSHGRGLQFRPESSAAGLRSSSEAELAAAFAVEISEVPERG